MILSVIERVLLGGLMAGYKGSFTNLKLVREGREALSFNEEELAELMFVQGTGTLTWNPEPAIKYQAVEIPLGENVTGIIKGILEDLNTKSELTDQHFSLYEKFVVPTETLQVVK